MSVHIKFRQAGPLFQSVKRARRAALSLHIPVLGPTRWLFASCYRLNVMTRELSIFARRFFWDEPLFRSYCVGIGSGLQMERLPYITGLGRIVLGKRVRMSGKSSIAFNSGNPWGTPELTIGDDTFIGHGCSFAVGRSIVIGNHCLVAGGVSIRDQDGHPLDAARRRLHDPTPEECIRRVRVGDDVWIGAGAVILKGIVVGNRAVIGAGAVVTRDVPPDSVVVGNPARIVKMLPSTSDIAESIGAVPREIGARG